MELEQKLKMKEITQKTDVSKSTILYYLSLGLLPEPEKTSKNTAYYPGSYLIIIPAIRYLQENMHLPLAVIKQLIDGIGFENFSIEQALHDYETFLSPTTKSGRSVNVYSHRELEESSRLKSDEIDELKNRKLLFSIDGESYYYDDLLAVSSYNKLQNMGIEFLEIEKLAVIIKDLAHKVHKLYHEKAEGLKRETEEELTNTMRKEFETVFIYLFKRYIQKIHYDDLYGRG